MKMSSSEREPVGKKDLEVVSRCLAPSLAEAKALKPPKERGEKKPLSLRNREAPTVAEERLIATQSRSV